MQETDNPVCDPSADAVIELLSDSVRGHKLVRADRKRLEAAIRQITLFIYIPEHCWIA